jgi:hypothetical protein
MDNSYGYATLQILVVPLALSEPAPMLKPWQDPKYVFGLLLKHHEYSIIRQNQGITSSPSFIFPGPNSGWCAIVYGIVVSNSGAHDSFPLTSHSSFRSQYGHQNCSFHIWEPSNSNKRI